MINTPNLRLARHNGAFGDFPCGCKICKDKREADKSMLWQKIATIIFFCLFLIGSCMIAKADILPLKASWYSEDSLKTEGTWRTSKGIMANGRVFDENVLTCATRLYPLGTRILVTNLNNNKSVLVVVTDRIGKRFAKTRIDLSKGAFLRIGILKAGLIPIKVSKVIINVKKG